MKQSHINIFTFLALVMLVSCSEMTPAGFWTNYQTDLLHENISDDGPYGGHRSMFWQARRKNALTSSDVITFAAKNGWQLIDSIPLSVNTLNMWEGTFPFTYTDFTDTKMNTSQFPRWVNSDATLFRFKTGWIAIEPGNARETDKNGYVLLNRAGDQLSVYHLWGE